MMVLFERFQNITHFTVCRITAKYVSKLSVFSNLTESVAESGVVAHAQLGAPVQLELDVEPRTKVAKLMVRQHPEYVNRNITAVHYQAAPYTVYEPIRQLITPVETLPSYKIQKQEPVRTMVRTKVTMRENFCLISAVIVYKI